MQTLKILGCGASCGVPIIGCKCEVCKSDSPYNKRRRSAILISSDSTKILVDAGYDIRNQLLGENIDHLDAVIITHDHADHVNGLDDLRVFKLIYEKKLPLYAEHATLASMSKKYDYLFNSGTLEVHAVDFNSSLKIGDIELGLFRQDHGTIDSLGIRVGDVVYSNDVIAFPEESKQYLRGAKTMIFDCISYDSTPTHSGLDLIMKWREEFKPEQIYLTNMSHRLDYFDIQTKLPYDIKPAYDGLKISCFPRA
jgi:phosphoribosyl 1,2-cyclic phosphate phosphodiesterase